MTAVEITAVAIVTPRAGVWIETSYLAGTAIYANKSRPVRACGLKQIQTVFPILLCRVTPRAGVWIETDIRNHFEAAGIVTPRAGVWIETAFFALNV